MLKNTSSAYQMTGVRLSNEMLYSNAPESELVSLFSLYNLSRQKEIENNLQKNTRLGATQSILPRRQINKRGSFINLMLDSTYKDIKKSNLCVHNTCDSSTILTLFLSTSNNCVLKLMQMVKTYYFIMSIEYNGLLVYLVYVMQWLQYCTLHQK